MSTPYLRAFLFDSAHGHESEFVVQVFETWAAGQAVAVISSKFPDVVREKAIVKCDPNEVVDIARSTSTIRPVAIVDTAELGCVVLTSGTTGEPKPVEHTFESMRNATAALYETCGLSSVDTWLCCLPPYYIAGLAIFARCFISESKLIFHARFDVERIRKAIKNESVTAISVVAPQLRALLDADVDLSSLKTVLVGGSSLPPELLEACRSKNIAIHHTYGLTETFGGICHDGELFDNTLARISDTNQIEIQTTSLMSGYRHDFRATQQRITPDGWLRTGDRGEIHDNKLIVFGRIDDAINSGGVKVDPNMVENVLATKFPQFDMAVCSTPHPTLGQCVTLCIRDSETLPALDDIRDSLKDDIASTHLPLRLATVDTFPRSDLGKIDRAKLAASCVIISEHELAPR